MTKLTTFLRKLLQIRCMLALGNCFQKLLHIRRPEMKLFIIRLNYVITNLVKTSRCKSQACQFQTGMYLNALIFLEKVFIPKKRGEGARSGSHGLTSQVFNSYPDTPVLGSAGWAWLTPVSAAHPSGTEALVWFAGIQGWRHQHSPQWYFPKVSLFPVKTLCLISNMTLSGFSFRLLVFIIPWANKPVHNHTHRYSVLTLLSCFLCRSQRSEQMAKADQLVCWKGESTTRKNIALKKIYFLMWLFVLLFKKTTAPTNAAFWDYSVLLNFSQQAPFWRAVSPQNPSPQQLVVKTLFLLQFCLMGDPNLFLGLPHFKGNYTMPISCSGSLLDCYS